MSEWQANIWCKIFLVVVGGDRSMRLFGHNFADVLTQYGVVIDPGMSGGFQHGSEFLEREKSFQHVSRNSFGL